MTPQVFNQPMHTSCAVNAVQYLKNIGQKVSSFGGRVITVLKNNWSGFMQSPLQSAAVMGVNFVAAALFLELANRLVTNRLCQWAPKLDRPIVRFAINTLLAGGVLVAGNVAVAATTGLTTASIAAASVVALVANATRSVWNTLSNRAPVQDPDVSNDGNNTRQQNTI